MWRIFCGKQSLPQNIVMDMSNVMFIPSLLGLISTLRVYWCFYQSCVVLSCMCGLLITLIPFIMSIVKSKSSGNRFCIGHSLPKDSHPFGVGNHSLIKMTYNPIQAHIKTASSFY